MDLWFNDEHTDTVKLSIKVEEQLFSQQSSEQHIDVLQTREFGKILVVDGDIMLTEKDEFIYHELLVHVAMAVNPNIKEVLVIGGGDGGVVRELMKYDSIDIIDVVEIDPLLVDVCKKYLPEMACSLDHEKVHIYNEDGVRFIRSLDDEYDLIIIDSPNPYGAGEGLFTREFYGLCHKALHDDGIMINQHESPFYRDEAFMVQRMHQKIVQSFPIVKVYQGFIPSYPSGHWLFGFASKAYHPLDDIKEEAWNALGIPTRYYATRLHKGIFALPVYVEELLKDVE
ncbi:polyamine aminopropyltransferase [Sharpea azabuensis]|uniref:polyamine aminopropyltransferase n=1 Tax=Sharpea azabuensis TaxID=322505 RepID=UPI001567D237|nr:polyamine aminopropyltransferase [Sharpea azabuensis]